VPLSQQRMSRRDSRATGSLLGAYPDGSHAPNEHERIVTDQLGGAGQFQPDCIVRKRPDVPKLIGHPEYDPGAVGPVLVADWS